MSDALAPYRDAAVAIGRQAAADYPELWRAESLPEPIWRSLADAGLLGLSTAPEHGGAGLSTDAIGRIARDFVRASGVKGLVTIWQAHNLMADWIFGRFATPAQQAQYLPMIAAGAATAAFAVSEPGRGAHPKLLATTAMQSDGYWVLNGEKAYVTNGPIATVFAIVAVVDEDASGRKQFGAFLVPRDTPGLSILPSAHVDFLKPSGHASLQLQDVRLPQSARLTDLTDIYPTMVLPLRDHEDAPGAWARLGGYERLAAAVAATADGAMAAGGLAARLRAVAAVLEHDPTADGLLAARAILGDVAALLGDGLEGLSPADGALLTDLAKLGGGCALCR